MIRRLCILLLFGSFYLCMPASMSAQCGSYIQEDVLSCGSCGGDFTRQLCEGVGDFCEDGTGDLTFGCCGIMLFPPGGCQSAQASPRRELLPSREFLALRDALALRRKLQFSQTVVASCSPGKNDFNDWLQARLKQQHSN